MHNPGEQHMNATMHILRYLKSAPGKGILFTKHTDYQIIDAYTGANWAESINSKRSTSGYFTFVGGNLVTWRSEKNKMWLHARVHKLNLEVLHLDLNG